MQSATQKQPTKIKLPRGYFSWSQLDLIEHNENEYIKKYILGHEREASKEQEFGKSFASILEGTEETDDEIVKLVKATIPKLGHPETELRAVLRSKGKEVELFGKLDDCDEMLANFLEYKTGKWAWTQRKAEHHGQLLFYKVMIWLIKNKIPNSTLIWAETENYEEDSIVLTGRIEPFEVKHELKDILMMSARIMRGAERASQLYQEEIDNTFN